MIDGCPGTQRFKKPKPEDIECPFCGAAAEIWTDEFQVACPKCKRMIGRKGGQCCLDWCKSARECAGDELYNKYRKSKNLG
jgi:hypothetical protein